MTDKITNIQPRYAEKELSPKQQAQALKDQIKTMQEQADEKVANARQHLIDSLYVTAEKYLTANGVMRCLTSLRECIGSNEWMGMNVADEMACEISSICSSLATTIEDIDDIDKLVNILDGIYDPDFAHGKHDFAELSMQLCLLDLCSQVGPAIQDVIDFRDAAVDEIENTQKELDELCKKQHVDKSKLK